MRVEMDKTTEIEIKTNTKQVAQNLLNIILLAVKHEVNNVDIKAKEMIHGQLILAGHYIKHISYSESKDASVKEIQFGTLKYGSKEFGLSGIAHIDSLNRGILASLTIRFFLENDNIYAEIHTDAKINNQVLAKITENELNENNIDIRSLFDEFSM